MKALNTIIFYENREEVENYITELNSIADGMVEICLVVNSDKSNQVKAMEASLRAKGITCLRVIDYGDNVGYLNTMLKTIKRVSIATYDYVILSNTDIHYDTEDFFQQLAEKEYPSDVGCIAPCVYASKSNSYSNPHYMERVPKAKFERLTVIFRYPLLGKMYLKLGEMKAGKTRTEKKQSCFVYSPHGSYMIFTKDFIKKIYGYEYGVKMYSEESAVGELLVKNKMRCYYDDSLSVIHEESSVTGKINYKRRFAAWRESIEFILKEFY